MPHGQNLHKFEKQYHLALENATLRPIQIEKIHSWKCPVRHMYSPSIIEADRKTYKQAAEKRIRETQKGVLSRTAMGWVFWIKTFWRLLTLCFLIACT
uniref:Calcium-dependent protein kinase 1 n=1 Tax=Rhizophora mucronata TaxID=61149 RepID=A0A2P2JII8_RHIMU